MALDFLMISDGGEILRRVGVSLDVHGQLFGRIDRSRYPQLGRIHDYYEDVMYERDDLNQLIKDLRTVRPLCEEFGRWHVGLVDELLSLAELARSESKRIDVVAD